MRNDATVADLPYTPMNKTVRVYYGNDLKEADLIRGGLGMSSAGFIAPQRAATHEFRFALPKGSNAASVTVEVTDLGDTVATFEGKITNRAK